MQARSTRCFCSWLRTLCYIFCVWSIIIHWITKKEKTLTCEPLYIILLDLVKFIVIIKSYAFSSTYPLNRSLYFFVRVVIINNCNVFQHVYLVLCHWQIVMEISFAFNIVADILKKKNDLINLFIYCMFVYVLAVLHHSV